MNSAQAKQLPLPKILARLGYQPVKSRKKGMELWYLSPFRQEQEPSFVTSYLGGKWIWNDFGDQGGTVIDFIMRHENHHRVKDALQFLESMFQELLFETPQSQRVGGLTASTDLFSFKQHSRVAASSRATQERELELIEATPIRNPIIYHYLQEERHILRHLVDRYLLQVTYRNTQKGRDYFAFGMRNASGGYEIRAASSEFSFKSALNGRDITLIRGKEPAAHRVNIFEGMTDFLSLLVMIRSDNLAGDSLILHSLSSFTKSESVIRKEGYQQINTFLDNNRAGQQGTKRYQETFPERVTSWSEHFAPYVDLNDALCRQAKIDFRTVS